jgi:chromosome segregation ATPase
MDEVEAGVLKARQADLEMLLEQIDHEQEFVDALETEIDQIHASLSNCQSIRESVKFASPPGSPPFSTVDAETRQLNSDIASLAIERRSQHARLEKVIQRRSQIQGQFDSCHQTCARLDEEFRTRSKEFQKAQQLLVRLRKRKKDNDAPNGLHTLLARIREVELEISEADRGIARYDEGGESQKNLESTLSALKSHNRLLSAEMPFLNDRYDRLRQIATKWRPRLRANPPPAGRAQAIPALLEVLDRRRVGANPAAVLHGRASLDADIASFEAECGRLRAEIASARVSSQRAEAALAQSIAQLRLSVASLRHKC